MEYYNKLKLRATGETEAMQENIQNWLELDEGDPGFLFWQRMKLLQMLLRILLWKNIQIVK
jgi:hypothetical protein